MIMKGLWRYHTTKPSWNRNPSRKCPDCAGGRVTRSSAPPLAPRPPPWTPTGASDTPPAPRQEAARAAWPLEVLV